MPKLKQLYVAESLQGLSQQIIAPKGCKIATTVILCRRTGQIINEAIKELNEGDEEMAYIDFVRYFNLIKLIEQQKDYAQKKEWIDFEIGDDWNLCQQMLEHLRSSLEIRYREQQLAKNMLIAMPLDNNNNRTNANSGTAIELKKITCVELERFITDNNALIIDCRPSKEFASSRLIANRYFNVPMQTIKEGLTAEQLARQINVSNQRLCISQLVQYCIILSTKTDEQNGIEMLCNILMTLDSNTNGESTWHFRRFDDSFDEFQLRYPHLIGDTQVQLFNNMINNVWKVNQQEHLALHIEKLNMLEREERSSRFFVLSDKSNRDDVKRKPLKIPNHDTQLLGHLITSQSEEQLHGVRGNRKMPRKANPKLLQAETIDSENDSSIVMRVKNRNRQPRKLQSNLLGKEPVRSKGKKPGLAPDNDFENVGQAGLVNLGNTCYMNCILQCLLNIDPLREYLTTWAYLEDVNRNSNTKGKIVENLGAIAADIWLNNRMYVNPVNFRNALTEFKEEFGDGEQQDSHEFLTILMDILHFELQSNKHAPLEELVWPFERKQHKSSDHIRSRISDLFYGEIISQITCSECNFKRSIFEAFSALSLELPENDVCDLKDCLNLYFHDEPINDWYCPQCSTKREANKKLGISKLPPNLIIHFKRFCVNYNKVGNCYKKKKTIIEFPLTDLNMKDYVVPTKATQNDAVLYNLRGVANHRGNLKRGHYTAICKNFLKERWFRFNDEDVESVDSMKVVSPDAYILFYSS